MILKKGKKVRLIIKINKNHLLLFRKIVKDNNPIHFNESFAIKHGYKKPIAYGLLVASFLSKIIGNYIPGSGAVIVESNQKFLLPAYENDTIEIISKVLNFSNSTNLITLESKFYNQYKELIIIALTKIKAPENIENVKKKNKNLPVLVIGGTGDIGQSIINKCLNENKKVIFTFNSNKSLASKIIKKNKNKKINAFRLDVCNARNIDLLLKFVEKKSKGLSGIVYCPSSALKLKFTYEFSSRDFQKDLNVHFFGFLNIHKKFLKIIKDSQTSIVLLISESAEGLPPIKQSSYIVAKSALYALGKSLATELGPSGIRVNMVSPGLIDSSLTKKIPLMSKEIYKINTPTRKLVSTEDVANVVSSLLADESKNLNGINLRVNGGHSII